MQLKSDISSGSSEEETISSDPVDIAPSSPVSQTTVEASLQGKPQRFFPFTVLISSFFLSHFDLAGLNCFRLDPSSAEPSVSDRGQPLTVNQESRQVSIELKGPPSRSSLEV